MSNEAIKLALDLATMHHTDEGYHELRSKVRVAAKEALAKQQQGEPVAVFDEKLGRPKLLPSTPILKDGQNLYTTQQRKPLTMFDTEKLAKQCGVEWTTRIDKLCKLASDHSIKE